MSVNIRPHSFKKTKKQILKSTLSSHYQVDRATFSKWLLFFCHDIFINKDTLKKRRKLTNEEVEKIKERLGEEPKFFWKKDLIRIVETDYKTIRENIKKYPSIYRLSKDEYKSLSKFPPKVAQRIINGLEGITNE